MDFLTSGSVAVGCDLAVGREARRAVERLALDRAVQQVLERVERALLAAVTDPIGKFRKARRIFLQGRIAEGDLDAAAFPCRELDIIERTPVSPQL